MANYNLTTQEISSSFQQLMQHDGDTNQVYDGTGSLITNLDVTSSQALTASYAENVVDPTWDNIQDKPSGLVSGSSQIILEDTTGNLSGSRIEGAVALATNSVSASIANSATTALLATSASHAEVADEVPYSGVTGKPTLVSGSSQVSYPELSNIPSGIVSGSSQVNLTDTTFVDGTEFMVLRTDGAGNLSFDYADRAQIEIRTDESIVKGDPLYVTGFSDGQNRVTVGKADASDPSKMPAYGVAYESVSQNTNTQMVALGTLQDIDTQTPNFNVGDTLYVAVGGGLTNVKPTGTNLIQNVGIVGRRQQNSGEILVSAIGRSNDVPNIPQGQAWVGDSNGVPQAVSTASWDAHADLTQLNQFTQSQEIYNTGINSYTASNDIRVGNIETYVTSSSQRLDLLEDFTGSQQALNTTFATTGSNVFKGNQEFNTGSLTFANMSGQVAINLGDASISNANEIFTKEITANGKFTAFAPNLGSGELINLNYPFTSSYGDTGLLIQTFSDYGGGTDFKQEVRGVDSSYFSQNGGGALIFETLNGPKIEFFSDSDINFQPSGSFTANKILNQTIDDLNNNNQVNNIKVNNWVDPQGYTISNSTFGWQRYDGTVHGFVQELYTGDYAYGSSVTHEPGRWEYASFASGSAYQGGGIKVVDQGNTEVHTTIKSQVTNLTGVMNLAAQDPLPGGNVGDLALSGSSLYFYDGTWRAVSLV